MNPSLCGSHVRPQATGYGNVYFAGEMAAAAGRSLSGAACLVSGSGNVARFTLEKLLHLGAKPISASDSNGYILAPDGLTQEMIGHLKDLKNVRRGRIKEMTEAFKNISYTAFDGWSGRQWDHKADCVFPSATQNEITAADADKIVSNGVWMVSEGSNMSTALEGVKIFQDAKIIFGPSKSSNAGGVAASGLEMSQNSMRYLWTPEEVEQRLKGIMVTIHKNCLETAARYHQPGDYVFGVNAAGFIKVAEAMMAQGLV